MRSKPWKNESVKHVFFIIGFCSSFHQIWSPIGPKNDRIAWVDLSNFGKRLALVAATCLSSCSGGFRDHFGTIWGACWNEFWGNSTWFGWVGGDILIEFSAAWLLHFVHTTLLSSIYFCCCYLRLHSAATKLGTWIMQVHKLSHIL